MIISKEEILQFIYKARNTLKNDEMTELQISEDLLVFVMREDFDGSPCFLVELLEGNEKDGFYGLIDAFGWLEEDMELLVDSIEEYQNSNGLPNGV